MSSWVKKKSLKLLLLGSITLFSSQLFAVTNSKGITLPPTNTIEYGYLDTSNIDFLTNQEVNLTGKWHFVPNLLVAPHKLNQTKNSSTLIPVPSNWNDEIDISSYNVRGHGTGSYWLNMKMSANSSFSLLINRTCSNAKIFFFQQGKVKNIEAIGKMGRTASNPLQSKPYAGSKLITLFTQEAGIYQLLIQVSNFNSDIGGLCGDIRIGNTETLSTSLTKQFIQYAMLTALIIMGGVYSLALCVQNQYRRAPLWLMSTCFSSAVFFLSSSGVISLLISSSEAWLYELQTKLCFISISWASLSLMKFYDSRFSGYLSEQWLNFCYGLTQVFILLFLVLPSPIITANSTILLIFWGIQAGSGAWILSKGLKDRKSYGLPMLLALTPLLFSIPLDITKHFYLYEIPIYSLYGFVFFMFIETQIVGRKFSYTFRLAERLSEHLQEEVDIQTEALNSQNRKLEHTQKALKNANNALRKLSITDGLTQVYNRMHFEKEFHKEWRRCSRQLSAISVLMIDVDNFKKLNDTAGHLAGDKALQMIADTLKNQVKRAGELVARYGGEEFVIMLPETDQRKALAIAEGLRSSIEQLDFHHHEKSYLITISLGISTTIPSTSALPDNLLEAADAALYESKQRGRNRVSIVPLISSQPASSPIKQSY